MSKSGIVKREFGYLKIKGFKLKHKKYNKLLHVYTFYHKLDPCMKIIITENLLDHFLDIKIRGQQHKILFSYQWNQLMASVNFQKIDLLIKELRILYQDFTKHHYQKDDFQKVIKIYSDLVYHNLNIILNVS